MSGQKKMLDAINKSLESVKGVDVSKLSINQTTLPWPLDEDKLRIAVKLNMFINIQKVSNISVNKKLSEGFQTFMAQLYGLKRKVRV